MRFGAKNPALEFLWYGLFPAFASGGFKCQVSKKLVFMKLLCALILVLLDRVPHQRVSSVCSVQKVVRRPNWLRESPILDKKFQIANNKRNSNGKIGKILVDRVSEELKSWPPSVFLQNFVSSRAELDLCLYRSLPVPARRPQTWGTGRQRISAPHAARPARIVLNPLVFVPLS